MENSGVLTAFVIVTAVAVVIQACILLAMAIAARKTQQEALTILREVRGHLTPILIQTKDVLTDAAPRIKTIAANLEETSEKVRAQSAHVSEIVDDVLRRTQQHVKHVDSIVGQSLTAVDETRANVTHLVLQPVKWASAIMSGLRGGVENFMQKRTGSFAAGFNAQQRRAEPNYALDEEEVLD